MTLQNRMTPMGDIVADAAHGTMMGNRGGRIHDPETRQLLKRRWASKRWICCVTDFKNRHRQVMGYGYTELFFLDEVTALAGGHRPCFECRRRDAQAFQSAWQQAKGVDTPPSADAMDEVLHAERLDGRRKRLHSLTVPPVTGAMVLWNAEPHLVTGQHLVPWHPAGYGQPVDFPKLSELKLITPPSILSVLEIGYVPDFHASLVAD